MTQELTNFETFPEDIQSGIRELGWSEPTEVQRRVIPIMSRGSDLIVQAMTGSGKTGAFGLPIIDRIDPDLKAIQALVLAPTRELGNQVAKELEIMGRHRGIETLAIYGGVAYGPQLDGLARGAQIVAGTPGRILDHLGSGRMKLDRLRILIFDEADELLSLGFWPDMKEIQKFVPRKRQSGLFSATIPERVRSLARVFLNDPEFISLVDEEARSPHEIEHFHYVVPAQGKDEALLRIIDHEDPDSAIIFCNTRDDVRFLSSFLRRNGLDADMIQGDMTQASREQVMKRIKSSELRFLVATDVAARGIDISDLSHVITYTMPDTPEVYLHRTGRTGRMGKTGTAISLVSGLDIGNFLNMQRVNRLQVVERELPSHEIVAKRIARRLQNRVEHDLRELGERERQLRQEYMLPAVDEICSTEEGRRDLSAILFAYMRQQPHAEATPVAEAAPAARSREPRRPRDDSPRDDSGRGSSSDDSGPPRRRRRRRRGGAS
jgi:ATP-dependent RNA helicase DeaD